MKKVLMWPAGMMCFLSLLAGATAGVHATIELTDVLEVRICWQSASNLIYQVQYCSGLDTDVWVNVSLPVIATGPRTCVAEAMRKPRRFFRVLGPDMVWISPGTFMMGSPQLEAEREDWGSDETLHEVTISQGFWIGKSYPRIWPPSV